MPHSSRKNIRIAHDSRGVVTATLDLPGRSVNVLNDGVFADLQALVDQWEGDTTVRLVVFRTGKESGFLAGADLREIYAIDTRQMAERISRTGQAVFDRLERLRIPTVAVIHGPCLGGGLEFALACRYRVARDDNRTRLGLVETELGLVPAWGGTQRLPARVGTWRALQMLMEARRLSAREARALGLVDGVLPADQYEEGVEQFTAELLAGNGSSDRPPGQLGSAALVMQAGRLHHKELANLFSYESFARLRDQTTLGQRLAVWAWRCLLAAHRVPSAEFRRRTGVVESFPAHVAVLRAVATGLRRGREAGLAEEGRAFAELLFTPACRALVGSFFERARANAARLTSLTTLEKAP